MCKSGFISIRHNEVRDLVTAEILSEVCKDVEIEPQLQPLTEEILCNKSTIMDENARVDVAARGFWIKGQKAFMDVRVFNPLAKTYLSGSLEAAHRRNEQEKKRKYAERIIQIEHGSFTPFVFSCLGEMSRECSHFYTRLSELLAEKRKIEKCETTNFIRTKLSFSLIRSCLLCIRGSRSHKSQADKMVDTDIQLASANCCLLN